MYVYMYVYTYREESTHAKDNTDIITWEKHSEENIEERTWRRKHSEEK